ncbi:MAG: hypothetical protein IT286_00345 [Proteobacteria bacterium]|nr:hypothetical protein [Pseudomonadota bacterium]
MHDSAFHAMENAFVFAETLEMRGFSLSRKKSNLALDLMACVWSFSLLMFLVLYRLQHHLWQLLGAVISFVILTILLRKFKKRSVVTQKIKTKFHIVDTVLMGWSLTFVVFSLIHTFLAQSYLSKESIQLYLLFDPVTHAFFIAHACIGILCLNSKRTKS